MIITPEQLSETVSQFKRNLDEKVNGIKPKAIEHLSKQKLLPFVEVARIDAILNLLSRSEKEIRDEILSKRFIQSPPYDLELPTPQLADSITSAFFHNITYYEVFKEIYEDLGFAEGLGVSAKNVFGNETTGFHFNKSFTGNEVILPAYLTDKRYKNYNFINTGLYRNIMKAVEKVLEDCIEINTGIMNSDEKLRNAPQVVGMQPDIPQILESPDDWLPLRYVLGEAERFERVRDIGERMKELYKVHEQIRQELVKEYEK